jgi:hypothetical protein
MATVYMLTTVDNPYNPFEDFNRWYVWDELHGYGSCEMIARIIKETTGMSKEEEALAVEDAIDKIVLNDFTTLYRKVNENTAKDLVKERLSPSFDKKYLPN